jgi:hypothetical protein
VTPRVALTVVLAMPARAANLKTSCALSKARSPLASRRTSHAPTTPSSVFPVAMPKEVKAEPAVVMFTRKALARTPGQTRRPKTRKAASAMPVGGHTGVALTWRNASLSPSLAAMK